MKKKNTKKIFAFLMFLALVGALNWGLVGAFGFNLVDWALGSGWIAKTLYILVGVGGLVGLWKMFKK